MASVHVALAEFALENFGQERASVCYPFPPTYNQSHDTNRKWVPWGLQGVWDEKLFTKHPLIVSLGHIRDLGESRNKNQHFKTTTHFHTITKKNQLCQSSGATHSRGASDRAAADEAQLSHQGGAAGSSAFLTTVLVQLINHLQP